jgi:PPOX class probable F420-dependent enzyme
VALPVDLSSEYGARVARRLEAEHIGWLVTVGPSGAPAPVPVWFLLDGDSILVYSQPDTPKLRNIAANPRVALHLNSDAAGNDIVTVSGRAARSDDPTADRVPAYIAKYAELIAGNSWTPESFAADYSVPIRIQPRRVRGF